MSEEKAADHWVDPTNGLMPPDCTFGQFIKFCLKHNIRGPQHKDARLSNKGVAASLLKCSPKTLWNWMNDDVKSTRYAILEEMFFGPDKSTNKAWRAAFQRSFDNTLYGANKPASESKDAKNEAETPGEIQYQRYPHDKHEKKYFKRKWKKTSVELEHKLNSCEAWLWSIGSSIDSKSESPRGGYLNCYVDLEVFESLRYDRLLYDKLERFKYGIERLCEVIGEYNILIYPQTDNYKISLGLESSALARQIVDADILGTFKQSLNKKIDQMMQRYKKMQTSNMDDFLNSQDYKDDLKKAIDTVKEMSIELEFKIRSIRKVIEFHGSDKQ